MLGNNTKHWLFFAVTQQILISSQIAELEVKEHYILHNTHKYDIFIQSELKFLIGGNFLSV
jgi:hypothetical protein